MYTVHPCQTMTQIFFQARRVREQEEIVETYYQEARESRQLDSIVVDILCYRGPDKNPRWIDVGPGRHCIFFGSSFSDIACPRRVLHSSVHYLRRYF